MADTIELLRDSRTGRYLPGTPPPNPGGRPRNSISLVRSLCQQHCTEAIELLLSIIRDGNARDRDRIAAAEVILERGLGKPIAEDQLEAMTASTLDDRERIMRAIPEDLRKQLTSRP